MVEVRVPASSANLGAGFDCAGIALQMYNTAYMQEWDGACISSLDGTKVPAGEDNLIYKTVKSLFLQCGKPFYGLKLEQKTTIPMTRGLGSSTACLAAGLVGANAMLGQPFTMKELIDLASVEEGHPDNTVPAFVGGYVNAVMEDGHVFYSKSLPHESVAFTVMIPPSPMATEYSRSVLPKTFSVKDAVYNISRAALLASALVSGDAENIAVSLKDAIHQPFRFPLIDNAQLACESAVKLGAYGVVLSGAGSTLLAVHSALDSGFAPHLQQALEQENICGWQVQSLKCDVAGVRLHISD